MAPRAALSLMHVARSAPATRHFASSIWIIEKLPKSRSQLSRQAIAPRFIDEPNVDHVPQVHSVLIAIGGELHANQRLQPQRPMLPDVLGFDHIGRGDGIFGADLLARENDAHGIA